MKPLLTVLIPTLKQREHKLEELFAVLLPQCDKYKVQVITDDHPTDSVGVKRARLADRSESKYSVYLDDDDMIPHNYMELVHHGLKKNVDVVELNGIISVQGKEKGTFHHSIQYDKWSEKGSKYFRPPTHLNPMRTKYFQEYPFEDIKHGEDLKQCLAMVSGGVWKNAVQHEVKEILYHYRYVNKK